MRLQYSKIYTIFKNIYKNIFINIYKNIFINIYKTDFSFDVALYWPVLRKVLFDDATLNIKIGRMKFRYSTFTIFLNIF